MIELNWWERFRAWLAYLIFPEPNNWYIEAVEEANNLEEELADLSREHEALIRQYNALHTSLRSYND